MVDRSLPTRLRNRARHCKDRRGIARSRSYACRYATGEGGFPRRSRAGGLGSEIKPSRNLVLSCVALCTAQSTTTQEKVLLGNSES